MSQTKCRVTFDTCFWHSFYAPSFGTPSFALHGSLFNHFLISGNYSSANQIFGKSLLMLPWKAKLLMKQDRKVGQKLVSKVTLHFVWGHLSRKHTLYWTYWPFLCRRHNYLPFIVELLKFLAAENQLTSVYEKAKEKSIALQKKKEERKAGLATNSFFLFLS